MNVVTIVVLTGFLAACRTTATSQAEQRASPTGSLNSCYPTVAPPKPTRFEGFAGPSEIRGTIVSADSGRPLPGATVTVMVGGRTLSAVADTAGAFHLAIPSTGLRRSVIVTRALAYQVQRDTVDLAPSTTLAMTILLLYLPVRLQCIEVSQ
jgi:hypothetical protein